MEANNKDLLDIYPYSDKKLFSENQILVSTLIAGGFAGFYMMYYNLKELGNHKHMNLIFGLAACWLMILIGSMFIPVLDRIPNFFYSVGITGVVIFVLGRLMKSELIDHKISGGAFQPLSKAILVSVLSVVAIVILLGGLSYLIY